MAKFADVALPEGISLSGAQNLTILTGQAGRGFPKKAQTSAVRPGESAFLLLSFQARTTVRSLRSTSTLRSMFKPLVTQRFEVGLRPPIPEGLLALAPLHLTNHRRTRYIGDDQCIALRDLAERVRLENHHGRDLFFLPFL